jgi:hypothetical protein
LNGLALIKHDACVKHIKTKIMTETKIKKPPIGIVPKNIWKSIRFNNLKEAMIRYLDAGLELPNEWTEEYNQFIKKIER